MSSEAGGVSHFAHHLTEPKLFGVASCDHSGSESEVLPED